MTFRRPSVVPLLPLVGLRKAQMSVARLWSVYNEQLVVRPVVTRSLTAVVGLVGGDVLAQLSSGERINTARCIRVAAYAFFINGPGCYKFYKFLDQAVYPCAPTSWRAVATKIFIDQFMFSPPFLCVYLSAMKVLEGRPHEVKFTIEKKAWPCITAGLAFWGPAHVLNFKLVPEAYRTLIVLAFGVAWSAILSGITAPTTLRFQDLETHPYNYESALHMMSG